MQLVEIKAKIADSKGEWGGGGGEEEMMPENSDIPFADAESIKNVRSQCAIWSNHHSSKLIIFHDQMLWI